MNQLTSLQTRDSYIPDIYYQEVIDEVMVLYETATATSATIPCLDEDIVKGLWFFHLAICYFYHQGGLVLEEEWYEDKDKWEELNELFSAREFEDEYNDFRSSVQQILHQHNMSHEENWVFGLITLNFEYTWHNIPLQSIW